MLHVTAFAAGQKYISEIDGWNNALKRNSPFIQRILGVQENNQLSVSVDDIFQEKIDIVADLLSENSSWNAKGIIKPLWIYYVMEKYVQDDDILVWTDIDSRVMGDLELVEEDLYDADLGMVLFDGQWLAGTIVARKTEENMKWFKFWYDECRYYVQPQTTNWMCNDQSVMRKLIDLNEAPGIIDLTSKWSSIPPMLSGLKENPIHVYPIDKKSLIWHWQASRGSVHGWNWPPEESKRI